MHDVPRSAAPHPAFAAALEGGPLPDDPQVLEEMTQEERTALVAFSRLSQPIQSGATPEPRKTIQA
jgi:hypothetical protein